MIAAFHPGEERVLSRASSASCSRSTPAPRSASSPSASAGSAGSSRRSRSRPRCSSSWLLRRGGSTLYCLGLALILGGALGNLFDRLTLGQGRRLPALPLRRLGVAGVQRRRQRDHRRRGAADRRQLAPAATRPGAQSTEEAIDGRPARQPARLLRRRRPRDRDRRAGARAVRRADLRAPRGRAQQVRRRRPEGEGRGVRRGAGRGARRAARSSSRAHGVSKAVRAEADARGLTVFDATCPLVTKVHVEVAKMREHGREIVMIGHRGPSRGRGHDGAVRRRHPPGRVGRRCRPARRSPTPTTLAYVTQTTLSVDDAAAIVAALKRRFPRIVGPKKDDICYATQNRQDAVKFMAPQVDVVIVVGSPNSSNSNRLREVAANRGVAAYMVDRADQLDPVDRGQGARRRHRRRVGARSAGARGDRATAASWAPAACASSRARPRTSCFRCRKGCLRRTPRRRKADRVHRGVRNEASTAANAASASRAAAQATVAWRPASVSPRTRPSPK